MADLLCIALIQLPLLRVQCGVTLAWCRLPQVEINSAGRQMVRIE